MLYHRDEELALAQARAAEQEISQGRWRGPLHGIPISQGQYRYGWIRTTAQATFLAIASPPKMPRSSGV